jgi:hypothetical protein
MLWRWSRPYICLPCADWRSSWHIGVVRRPGPNGQGGSPRTYREEALLLIALLKTLWRLSYQDVHDWLISWPALALACGLQLGSDGQPRVPSPSQLCKRGPPAGAPLYEALFVLTVWQAMRARLIGARDLITESAPILAWRRADPDAALAITSATVRALAAPGARRTARRGRPPVCSWGSWISGASRQQRTTAVMASTYQHPCAWIVARSFGESPETESPVIQRIGTRGSPGMFQHSTSLFGFRLERYLLGHLGSDPSRPVPAPPLWQKQPSIQEDMPMGARIGQQRGHLTVLNLAQGATLLFLDALCWLPCDIRPLNEPFESPFPCFSLLADSSNAE